MITVKMNRWESFRIALSAVAIGGVILVLGQELLLGEQKEKQAAINFPFPETIPLTNWQAIKSTPLAATVKEQSDPGRLYQYRSTDEKLEVKVRHQLYTDGNASRLLMVYEGIPPATILPKVKQKKEMGAYAIFDYQDKAYLSACLPPKGETSVTQQQYINNRSRYGWSLPRAFWWVLGQQDLFDSRCLWTVMVTPVDTYSSVDATDQAFEKLEKAWLEWHQWWQDHPSVFE